MSALFKGTPIEDLTDDELVSAAAYAVGHAVWWVSAHNADMANLNLAFIREIVEVVYDRSEVPPAETIN